MARAEDFPPAKVSQSLSLSHTLTYSFSSLYQHLDILQAHKGNIFEVNLPNKVTKIMEVPKKGSVREAIQPVLKKNNYSLDVIDLKFADTLKVCVCVCVFVCVFVCVCVWWVVDVGKQFLLLLNLSLSPTNTYGTGREGGGGGGRLPC